MELTKRRLFFLLAMLLPLVGSLVAQTPAEALPDYPTLPPGGGFIGAPLSSKIWDDPSLQNLASKGHKALGYATMTLATSAFVLQQVLTADTTSGQAIDLVSASAAVSGSSTVLAGIVSHWGKLTFSGDLVTWNNLHALTGATGTSLIVAGQVAQDRSQRTSIGLAGALLLLLAVMFEG